MGRAWPWSGRTRRGGSGSSSRIWPPRVHDRHSRSGPRRGACLDAGRRQPRLHVASRAGRRWTFVSSFLPTILHSLFCSPQRADGSGAPTQLSTAAVQQVAASTAEYAGSVLRDGAEVIYAEVASECRRHQGDRPVDDQTGPDARAERPEPPALARPPVAGLPAARVWHRRGLRESLPGRRGRQVAGLDRRRCVAALVARWQRALSSAALVRSVPRCSALATPAAGTLEMFARRSCSTFRSSSRVPIWMTSTLRRTGASSSSSEQHRSPTFLRSS